MPIRIAKVTRNADGLMTSMVQEEVFWLHDHGLTIASVLVPPEPTE